MCTDFVCEYGISIGKIWQNTAKIRYFRKRSEDAQITFVFIFIFFLPFLFSFFDNCFHFRSALKIAKISKTIVGNQKLPFSFSSLDLGSDSCLHLPINACHSSFVVCHVYSLTAYTMIE